MSGGHSSSLRAGYGQLAIDAYSQEDRHFTVIASIVDKGGEGHCKGLFKWDQHRAAEDGTADVCAGVVNQGGIIVKLNK